MDEIKIGQIWQHFKGGQYKIIAIAKESEDLQDCVVYEALYDDPISKIWIRTKNNFTETIERDGQKIQRFRLLKNPD